MSILRKYAKVLSVILLLELFMFRVIVGAEANHIKIGMTPSHLVPSGAISFFSDVLTIHDTGLIRYQGRELATDEEVFWGLQQMIVFYYDQEKLCSRRDALAALRAAHLLLSDPHNHAASSAFHEGYNKCFPPS